VIEHPSKSVVALSNHSMAVNINNRMSVYKSRSSPFQFLGLYIIISSQVFTTTHIILDTMHLKQALIATAFGTAVIASPLDVKPRNVPQQADFYNVINLDDFDLEANNGTLEKRIDWRWCVRNGENSKAIGRPLNEESMSHPHNHYTNLDPLAQKCVNTGGLIVNTVGVIANIIYANSNSKDCSYHDGTVDDAQFQVHATGSNCDTTAELETIEGGLSTYFKSHGGAVCDVHCVQQNHGGTYRGYLKIAPKGYDISQVVCDDSVPFNDGCGEGGKNDAP
jgi:hypothetical protein